MPLIDIPHANKSYATNQTHTTQDSNKRRAAAAAALLTLCALAALASTGTTAAASADPLQTLINKPPVEKTSIVDFAEAGVATGGGYALAAAHTGADFMLDSNFSLEGTRDEYVDKGDGTKTDFGELVEGFLGPELTAEAQHAIAAARAQAIEATKDAAVEPAVEPAPAEKTSVFDIAKQGVQTGGEYALLGGKTGLAFMTDSNFTMDKTADDFAGQGSKTEDAWGGIATGLLGPRLSSQAEAVADAAKETAKSSLEAHEAGEVAADAGEAAADVEPAPAEKTSMFDVAKQGVQTGGEFALLGGKTGLAFMTDSNFTMDETTDDFAGQGSKTKDAWGGIATGLLGPQLASQAEAAAAAAKESITEGDDAAAATETPAADEPPAEKDGWMPFAQNGAETGENFGNLGAKTAENFVTNPDFDFGKAGSEFQAEGAATESTFGAKSPAEKGGLPFGASSPAEKDGWMPYAQAGAETGEAWAETGENFGDLGAKTAENFVTNPPAEKDGWMPYAQAGAETGENFGDLGAKTAENFVTNPDFDFGKTGGEFQAEGAATESAFGSIGKS